MIEDIFNIGADDRDIDLFEGQYKVNGMRYNSYLIMDEKVCVLDSVAENFGAEWLKSIREIVIILSILKSWLLNIRILHWLAILRLLIF